MDVPLFEISWDRPELQNAVDSITRGSYWANGPYVDEFEDRVASYLGVEHAVVTNSGTTAMVAALEAHGVGPGDEVIVPAFTFISTANAVRLVGARPVFADIERDRYGLDPEAVRAQCTERTAAVMPVHYAGTPCRIGSLRAVADDCGAVVIEDAAEAFGARVGDHAVGSVGDSAICSFCQNKVVATGEGGAVVTDDDDVAQATRLVRSHGRASGDYFDSADGGRYVQLGSNYRMPDVVAAIGVGQMDRVEELIGGRRRVADRYSERLAAVDGVEPMGDPPDGRHVYQLYPVTFAPEIDRDAVADALADRGVSSKVYFEPVHHSEYYRETYDRDPALPVTEDVSERVLSLPIHPEMAPDAIDHVVESLTAAVDDARAPPAD